MTDPERLLARGTTFEQSLLAAGAGDKPGAALIAKMEQGLGLSSSVASAATLKGVLAAIGATVVGGIAAWGLLTSDGAGVERQNAEAVVGDPVLVVPEAPVPVRSQAEASSLDEARADEARADEARADEGRADEGRADEARADESSVPAPELRQAEEPTVAGRRAPKTQPIHPRSTATATDRLSEEVRELDRVRAALEAGKQARAFQLLDAYDRRFPAGTLKPEARKLRQSARELD
jgi:hypothetical protein